MKTDEKSMKTGREETTKTEKERLSGKERIKRILSRIAPFRDGRRAGEKRSGADIALLVLDILCAVSGGFFLAVYTPYLFFHLPKGHTADVIAALLVFAGVLLPVFCRKLLKKLLKKAYTPLKAVWCAAMTFYMISFLVFCAAIGLHEDAQVKAEGKQPVVIVFGCQVHNSGVLSAELKSRLDTAFDVLNGYPDAVCVVSGGKGADEPYTEASAMKSYLTRRGIDEDRILTEERATDTNENLRLSMELLEQNGYAKENCSFICVSSNFHTPRVELLFEKLGYGTCATVSAPTPYKFNQFIYTVREYMSYVYLLVFGK